MDAITSEQRAIRYNILKDAYKKIVIHQATMQADLGRRVSMDEALSDFVIQSKQPKTAGRQLKVA